MNHTPEPWRIENGCIYSGSALIIKWLEPKNASNEDNARRIVACVNACAGLATQQLEQTTLRAMLDGAESFLCGFEDDVMQDRCFRLLLDDIRETLSAEPTT